MSVKVIEPAKPKTVKCVSCGSLLEYEYEDILSFMDCDGDVFRSITCPRCKNSTHVEEW
jgi:ribosomal protein S27E